MTELERGPAGRGSVEGARERAFRALLVLLWVAAGGCGGEEPAPPPGDRRAAAPAGEAAGEGPVAAASVDTVPLPLTGLWLAREGGSVLLPCGGDRVLGVAGGPGGVLERTVRLERPGSDGPVLVTVRGRVAAATAADVGLDSLEVVEVLRVHDASACPDEALDRALEGTAWQLAGLPRPDPSVSGGGAWLRLREDEGFVEGHTGCRPLSGRFAWTVSRLRFQGLAPSAGACPGDALHAGFLEALARTGSYRIRGDTLELLGEAGPVATFRAPGD